LIGLASEQTKASKEPSVVGPAAPPSRTDQAKQTERRVVDNSAPGRTADDDAGEWAADDDAGEWAEDDGAGEWAEEAGAEPRPAKKAEPPAYYTWLAALVGAALVWVFQSLRR
jgi:hypothetical protein